MSDTSFQPGDRVRVTFEAEVYQPGGMFPAVRHPYSPTAESSINHLFAKGYLVELIERADDPSKDPIGTVRLSASGDMYIALERPRFPSIRWRLHSDVIGWYTDEDVRGSQVIGAVPGTPAYDSWVQAQSVYEDGHAAGVADAMAKVAADELSAETQTFEQKVRYFTDDEDNWRVTANGTVQYQPWGDGAWRKSGFDSVEELLDEVSVREVESLP